MPNRPIFVCALALLLAAPIAAANTSHAGWPKITGMLLMNKADQSRPLDGRPDSDPFDGADPRYSCYRLHRLSGCLALSGGSHPRGRGPMTVPAPGDHNELLGGHGNDVIHAGPAGDVLWGDYKPSGQPTTQVDELYGGPGKDYIYASHGQNTIRTGGGNDVVHAHFGHGSITCDGSGSPTIYLSRDSRKHYNLDGCHHISYATLGY